MIVATLDGPPEGPGKPHDGLSDSLYTAAALGEAAVWHAPAPLTRELRATVVSSPLSMTRIPQVDRV